MSIIDWISDNYKWMFSGIGIAIGIPFISYLYNKVKSNNINLQNTFAPNFVVETERKQEEKIANSNHSLDIAAEEIESKQDVLSELEFDEYFTSLNGYTIIWKGRIATVSTKKEDNNIVRIQMTFAKQLRAFFEIKLAEFPNIKLFKSDDTATITGRIHSANWPTFNLLNAKLLDWSRK